VVVVLHDDGRQEIDGPAAQGIGDGAQGGHADIGAVAAQNAADLRLGDTGAIGQVVLAPVFLLQLGGNDVPDFHASASIVVIRLCIDYMTSAQWDTSGWRGRAAGPPSRGEVTEFFRQVNANRAKSVVHPVSLLRMAQQRSWQQPHHAQRGDVSLW